jgi:hypothetical protein
MPAFLLPLLGYAKSGLGSALAFLKGLNPWQIACLGLALFALVQHFEIVSARHTAAKWQKQYEAVKAQLDSVSSKRNEQKQTSEKTVTQVVQGQERVKTVVKTIHDAPNPPDCKTPGLDNLRNVL